MTFVDRFKQLNWDDIGMSIFSKTAADVERALSKPKRDLEDFKALISGGRTLLRADGTTIVGANSQAVWQYDVALYPLIPI